MNSKERTKALYSNIRDAVERGDLDNVKEILTSPEANQKKGPVYQGLKLCVDKPKDENMIAIVEEFLKYINPFDFLSSEGKISLIWIMDFWAVFGLSQSSDGASLGSLGYLFTFFGRFLANFSF